MLGEEYSDQGKMAFGRIECKSTPAQEEETGRQKMKV
jgi:hypothetical protein